MVLNVEVVNSVNELDSGKTGFIGVLVSTISETAKAIAIGQTDVANIARLNDAVIITTSYVATNTVETSPANDTDTDDAFIPTDFAEDETNADTDTATTTKETEQLVTNATADETSNYKVAMDEEADAFDTVGIAVDNGEI